MCRAVGRVRQAHHAKYVGEMKTQPASNFVFFFRLPETEAEKKYALKNMNNSILTCTRKSNRSVMGNNIFPFSSFCISVGNEIFRLMLVHMKNNFAIGNFRFELVFVAQRKIFTIFFVVRWQNQQYGDAIRLSEISS